MAAIRCRCGNVCQLNVKIAGSTVPGPTNPGNQLVAGPPPPALIIQADDNQQPAGGSIPTSDVGLAAPIINELLPNPAAPLSDNEDEFIELYNSNDKVFDLTGFKLQVGTRSHRGFNFPAGTTLPPHGFVAFYSIDTGLSLSNTGGQVRLLDPLDNVISQTDIYGSAKEGQSWALGNGSWYWSVSPTPSSLNIIDLPKVPADPAANNEESKLAAPSTQPESSFVNTAPINAPTNKAKVKATSTAKRTTSTSKPAAKAPKTAKSQAVSTNNSVAQPAASQPKPTPQGSSLHIGVLAGVGGLALLYALYEYRHDLANRVYQFRRYRETRRAARQVA